MRHEWGLSWMVPEVNPISLSSFMSCSLHSWLDPVALTLGDSSLKARHGKEARGGGALGCRRWSISSWDLWPFARDGRSVMWCHHCLVRPGGIQLAVLDVCSSWRVRGSLLENLYFFCVGTSLGFPQDLQKVAWIIGPHLCEAFLDRQIFVYFSIGNLFGGSRRVGAGCLYFLSKNKHKWLIDLVLLLLDVTKCVFKWMWSESFSINFWMKMLFGSWSFVYHYFHLELDVYSKSLLWLLDVWYWLGM